jgi:predicted ATPase
MAQVVIVSGPPGAGKSTVCEALCERYDRTVHLHTDDVYAWIRMGYIPPWRPGSASQNLMVSRAAARAATAFAEQSYGVFIDGVIGPAHLPNYLDALKPSAVAVHLAVLLPPLDVVQRRAAARAKQIAGAGDMIERVYAMFVDAGRFGGGVTIDNASLSAQETADRIMDACGRGDALVMPPA